MKACINCNTRPSASRGRCGACYMYYRRNGRDSTPAERNRRPHTERPYCTHCKQERRNKYRALCDTCYAYQRLRGRPRPARLWRYRNECRHCKRPYIGMRVKPSNGFCHTCYSYARRTGNTRPAELIQAQAPLGWCDCGMAAVEVRAVTLKRRTAYHMRLCAECQAIEDEWQDRR